MLTDSEIQGTLSEHCSTVLRRGDSIQQINVQRSHLLNDLLAAYSRPTFDPSVNLKVRFIGEWIRVDHTQSLLLSGSFFSGVCRGNSLNT